MTGPHERLPGAVWWLAAAGVVLRLAFGFAYWVDEPLTRDEVEYLSLARGLTEGRGFTHDPATGPVDAFGRAPGYPVFLALIGAGRGVPTSTPAIVTVAQSVLAGLGLLALARLAQRLGGGRSAVAATALGAVFPSLVWTCARVFSEALFWPLGLGALLVFDAVMLRRPTRHWPALLSGATIGALILIRPGFLLFLPIAAGWLILRRHIAATLLWVLGAAVVVAPWTIRNYHHHGRLVLVASEGGITFWTGNHPLAIGEGDLAANPQLKRAQLALRAMHPRLNEEDMEPIYYQDALAWMAQHPVRWLGLEAKKAFYLLVPVGPSYRLHSWRYTLLAAGSLLAVAPFALVGWRRSRATLGRTPGLWLASAAAVLTCLIFFPQERFRTTTLDPALIVLASACWRRPTS